MARVVAPETSEAQPDPVSFDELREACPVSRSEVHGWSLSRHADLLHVLHDHETFSNRVSQHLSVPNGMDPPEHTAYRRIIEPYFAPAQMNHFEPRCRTIAKRLTQGFIDAGANDFMEAFAGPFAGRAQCAFLGWPEDLHDWLRTWTRRNLEATGTRDRERLAALTREFADQVKALLDDRRRQGGRPQTDLTERLLHERVYDRSLTDEEIVSILRNWTAGEIGTIAAAVGIVVNYLAAEPALQARLRGDQSLLPAAIDEILRLDGPLVANRRRSVCPVETGGERIGAEAPVRLVWIAANRDPEVFEEPDTFRLDRDPADNLLYGAGIHVCPGAPLARLELRVVMEELLRATSRIEPDHERSPVRAIPPAAGFERLPLRLVA